MYGMSFDYACPPKRPTSSLHSTMSWFSKHFSSIDGLGVYRGIVRIVSLRILLLPLALCCRLSLQMLTINIEVSDRSSNRKIPRQTIAKPSRALDFAVPCSLTVGHRRAVIGITPRTVTSKYLYGVFPGSGTVRDILSGHRTTPPQIERECA